MPENTAVAASNEKVIIKGDLSKANIIAIICFILAIVSIVISIGLSGKYYERHGFFGTFIAPQSAEGIAVLFYLFVIFFIIGVVCHFAFGHCEITVTNLRVYGKAKFGKLVDLPLDMISSVGTKAPKGVSVATSSGMIQFYLLENQEEIYEAISELLRNRQGTPASAPVSNSSNADELSKFKDLLDKGIITQEEFDAKKKQLLGL